MIFGRPLASKSIENLSKKNQLFVFEHKLPRIATNCTRINSRDAHSELSRRLGFMEHVYYVKTAKQISNDFVFLF